MFMTKQHFFPAELFYFLDTYISDYLHLLSDFISLLNKLYGAQCTGHLLTNVIFTILLELKNKRHFDLNGVAQI